jgi:hypothetical protein
MTRLVLEHTIYCLTQVVRLLHAAEVLPNYAETGDFLDARQCLGVDCYRANN